MIGICFSTWHIILGVSFRMLVGKIKLWKVLRLWLWWQEGDRSSGVCCSFSWIWEFDEAATVVIMINPHLDSSSIKPIKMTFLNAKQRTLNDSTFAATRKQKTRKNRDKISLLHMFPVWSLCIRCHDVDSINIFYEFVIGQWKVGLNMLRWIWCNKFVIYQERYTKHHQFQQMVIYRRNPKLYLRERVRVCLNAASTFQRSAV